MSLQRLIRLAGVSVGLLTGCTGSEILFPIEPKIEFVSLEPKTILEGEVFNITIKYQDGDGDLGDNSKNSDKPSFIVIDNRRYLPPGVDSTYASGFLPNLTPNTRSPSIQGKITMRMEAITVADPNLNEERFTYSIYIVDRKGHKSNTIQTDSLTIKRF